MLRWLDPRRSLTTATVWLITLLAGTFAVAASLWVGSIARDIVLQQHARRLALETDQVASDVAAAIAARTGALRVAESMLAQSGAKPGAAPLGEVFGRLVAAYPELDWLAIVDSAGRVVAESDGAALGADVARQDWYQQACRDLWVGMGLGRDAGDAGLIGPTPALGEFAAPLRDRDGHVVAVVAARLSWRWVPNHLQRLSEAVGALGTARAALIGPEGTVVAGASGWRGSPWPGRAVRDAPDLGWPVAAEGGSVPPRFERMPDGSVVLVARGTLGDGGRGARYVVLLSEPQARVYERANRLSREIVWISVLLGVLATILGGVGAHRLTRGLRSLTLSVAAVGHGDTPDLEPPPGVDEVARLGQAFSRLLDDLREERAELRVLSRELERRVELRTREVERLAEEARYAAVVRERLRIARAMHDTLAHTMMALLSEIRLLRRLHAHEPTAVAAELARAEQVAHDGLVEARSAIGRMRVNPVRDTGLGAALQAAVTAFANHTGIATEFGADPVVAEVGDERAETVFTMAAELLRNIERHAGATQVAVGLVDVGDGHAELRVSDNGSGFDSAQSHPGHYGLVGLREQAQLIGATLAITSDPATGTAVTIRWRISPERF